MVIKISKNNEKYYQCKICKLKYKEKHLAEKCQDWCIKHNSCNLEIIKKSVEKFIYF